MVDPAILVRTCPIRHSLISGSWTHEPEEVVHSFRCQFLVKFLFLLPILADMDASDKKSDKGRKLEKITFCVCEYARVHCVVLCKMEEAIYIYICIYM